MQAGLHSSQQLQSHHTPRRNPPSGVNLKQPCFNEGDGTVQRIDGKSGNLVATIETGVIGKGAIAIGGGFVWVSTHAVPIIQIDPRTNSVRGKFKLAMDEYSTVRFGGGSLWVSGGSVRRIKPP